ncbi:hypothetical protein JOF55_002452 [Haloactinomyces albus]|uniref:Uncharacterized protein n=1 Tax=Haloactinomyces albus TaxID=1352928 RepID=A0AAE3ZCA5_9ACTN|nr:hypothetical protein [Haloactinomyces albus]
MKVELLLTDQSVIEEVSNATEAMSTRHSRAHFRSGDGAIR